MVIMEIRYAWRHDVNATGDFAGFKTLSHLRRKEGETEMVTEQSSKGTLSFAQSPSSFPHPPFCVSNGLGFCNLQNPQWCSCHVSKRRESPQQSQ
ncbi:hypothetical protein VNO78_01477 [Psophocarpus tetragonolobus]|uniref:Uncharacterized protein n=1 Tax=Psophocarpus tetragonolobus TaxID=3891 RepID=A0AAN9XUP9_PSOTE